MKSRACCHVMLVLFIMQRVVQYIFILTMGE